MAVKIKIILILCKKCALSIELILGYILDTVKYIIPVKGMSNKRCDFFVIQENVAEVSLLKNINLKSTILGHRTKIY